MTAIVVGLIILLVMFIFMYTTERIFRKKYFEWYKEAERNHIATLERSVNDLKDIEEDVESFRKSLEKEKVLRAELYNNFSEWIELLETQTLTDELKEEIIRNANFDMD
jgi:biopolymer transport protein ExbB/TolQ